MSTFRGKIQEIDYISVDRFDKENLNSTVYFLSHCHSDHMQGLYCSKFHNDLLKRPEVYLYASPVSCVILKGMFPSIKKKLKELRFCSPTLIAVPSSKNEFLCVTSIPAGHCPGSVMFLFEMGKTVLYTGDYRVSNADLKKYRAFYDSFGQLKKINKVYLDTTFFNKSYEHFPAREKSSEAMCNIITDWFKASEKHKVFIGTSARYGSEYLFIDISKKMGMPIHVDANVYNFCKHIPEMDQIVTQCENATRIYAAFRNQTPLHFHDDNVLRIMPSALIWKDCKYKNSIVEKVSTVKYRVCYSCHPSFEETNLFLSFLKPDLIEACVVPDNEMKKNEMLKLLEDTIKFYKDSSEENENNVKPFEIGKKYYSNHCMNSPLQHSSLDLPSSPPRCFKKKRLILK